MIIDTIIRTKDHKNHHALTKTQQNIKPIQMENVMIFNELFKMWNKTDLMSQALNDSHEMTDVAYKMFVTVKGMLLDGCEEELHEEVKKEDYLLNHFERSIRKKVFEHISVNEKEDQDLYTGILLTTIVGNIERLGDYCKNISEVAEIRDALIDKDLNEKSKRFLNTLDTMFKSTVTALKDADNSKVTTVFDQQFAMKTEIDKCLMELATRKIENNQNNVAYALLYRYIKRLGAHLKNIASSITNPIDMIGYYIENDEK